MDSLWKTRMSPPLSLLVLGALTPPEHDILIEDENIEHLHLDDTPDLVGITVKVDTTYRPAEISARYRARGIPVVWGGIHATMCPDECLPYANAVVVGEAEILWSRVLADAAAHQLRGVYRNTGPVDIARVPIPRWDLMKDKAYLFTNTLRIGRGCPWHCDFCYNSSPNIDSRYRAKPVANVINEIRSLNTHHVMFIDDNFIGDITYARQLLLALRDLHITWHTAVSADIGKHNDILDLMVESGCKTLFIGFETLTKGNLESCRKRQNTIVSYDETIRKIHERGMMVNASLAFGFDEDDETVFPATLEWLVRNKVETMTGHILTPYPGTALYTRLLAEGRIIDNNLEHYNTSHIVFRPKRMSPEQLVRGYRWIYDQFYSWPCILQRWPATISQAIAYVQFAVLYRKFGKITSQVGRLIGMRPLAKLATWLAYAPALRHRRVTASIAREDMKLNSALALRGTR